MIFFKEKNGVSLLEVIIVMSIFSGIIFVVVSFVTGNTQFEDLVNQKLQVRQDLEQTFQTLVTEIRSMGPSESGAYPIASATTSSLSFYGDVDLDGIFELVRYSLSTSTLDRGITEPSGNPVVYSTSTEIKSPAVEKVVTSTVPVFEYFDSAYVGSGTAMMSPINIAAIRIIRVSVYADLSPKAPEPIFFSDVIDIRNLRSN